MGLRNKRPRVLVYSVRAKGVYSGDKIKNAVKHYKKLQTRKTVEGVTTWIQDAEEKVLAKLKKYGISVSKI